MKFLQELYLGEQVAPKVDQIVKKINNNEIVPNLYVIALASNADNMLDLIPEWELLQKGYPQENILVVGLAKDKKDAVGLVQFIIEECFEKTGSADVRAYLKEKWEGQA